MLFNTRVICIQSIVQSIISEWLLLLEFLQQRRLSLGITPSETTESFIHRVRTAHVWTQGLAEEDFVKEVHSNHDLCVRVGQLLNRLYNVQSQLTGVRYSSGRYDWVVTDMVSQLRDIVFPVDQGNYFEVSDREIIYTKLRELRLSDDQKRVLADWPVTRPDTVVGGGGGGGGGGGADGGVHE
jgi:hypothetical protein